MFFMLVYYTQYRDKYSYVEKEGIMEQKIAKAKFAQACALAD